MYRKVFLIAVTICLTNTAYAAISANSSFQVGSQVVAGGGGISAANGYLVAGIVGQGNPIGASGVFASDQVYAGFAYTTQAAGADSDSDGVANLFDNCPAVANTTQSDINANGIGDACDTTSDSDGDGINDAFDNCPATVNSSQSDGNSNGIGDVCEDSDGDGVFDVADTCPGFDDHADADDDGVADGCDNCQYAFNPNQHDDDNDGFGNACELSHTPFSATYYGYVQIDNQSAAIGDEIAVYDPDGILCGYDVIQTVGQYGFMAVYGDDPSTPEDEGAVADDLLTFIVKDASTVRELSARPVLVSGTLPWSDLGYSQVDLKAYSEIRVPLWAGWNLISIPIASAWYVGATPTVALPGGVEAIPVASISEVFSSIAGKYTAVRSYDENGVHTYAPDLPEIFNDLKYIAGGYGYWIKMTEDVDLVLEGPPLLPIDTLALHTGWNLVGCWSDEVMYTGMSPPEYAFPYGATYTSVSTITDILGSLDGRLSLLRGFDATGATTYDPYISESFNTLKYMGPGYGYWMKLSDPANLNYGD